MFTLHFMPLVSRPLANYNKARVEAPIFDHFKDFAPDLEKYEVVQNFPV